MKSACSLLVFLLAAADSLPGQPYTIHTSAGTGDWVFNGDGGLATSANLWIPHDVAPDGAGNLYIADSGHHRIRKVTVGGIITTVVGTGLCSGYTEGSAAINAGICLPTGLAIDTAGNLYIAGQHGHRVSKVTPGGVITTVAGGGSDTGDGIAATAARLSFPTAVAVDATGAVYIAEWAAHRIRKVVNGIITTVAGTGTLGYSGDGGSATAARLSYPTGVAVDAAGSLYIFDGTNFRIRKVTPGGLITTIAGVGQMGSTGDGGFATNARLSWGGHLKIDGGGNLLVADAYNHRIRKINAAGIITTIAGTGASGFSGDSGPAVNARFDAATSAAPDGFGNIYVADQNNDRIRRLTPAGTLTLDPASATLAAGGGSLPVQVSATPGTQTWTAASHADWLLVTSGASGMGNGQVNFTVAPNPASAARTGVAMIGWQIFTVTQAGTGGPPAVRFVPVTPCRVVDTRPGEGTAGPFGPPMMATGSTRVFPMPTSPCNIPVWAVAYSLNVTVVPQGPLSYLSIWPAGSAQPLVSTLNSFEGRVVANAAIVPAGNEGAISVFVTGPTHVIVDINGYFSPPGIGDAFPFYALAPCRVVDTRPGAGKTGEFGPPVMNAGSARTFPMLNSSCAIPGTARAFSLNATVVPDGPLGYLTLWPAGLPPPLVSTLNSFEGRIVANAAIVPAGVGNAIQAYVTDSTHLILDINGYFGPAVGGPALSFYPVTPCRVADTRVGEGKTGPFGPPALAGRSTRVMPIPQGGCGIPATALAYSLNVTVVPAGPLAYLTAWPAGQAQPLVSTLNSFEGRVVANAAIVPAGTDGAISLFVTNPTEVIVDINGYFAP